MVGKVFLICLSVVTLSCVAQAQEQCRCRAIEPEDPCSNTVLNPDGTTCSTKTTGCSGCICDETGNMNCDLDLQASSYQYLTQGQPECSLQSSIRTVCPEDSSTIAPTASPGAPKQRMLEDACSIDEPLSWKDLTCDVICFPPSYGTIYSMEIEYYGNFVGTYSVTAETTIDSDTLVRITPSVIAEVTHLGTYLFDDDVSSREGSQTNIRASPRFSQNGFEAGAVVTGDVNGDQTEFADDPPADGYGAYVCEGSQTETSFVILAEITNSITGSLQATTEGEFYSNITIKYFFETTGDFGTPVE